MVKDVWFVIFNCVFAFKGKCVSASCPLTITPSRVVVKYGDSLSANCSATSDQIDGMGWESDYKGTGLQNVDFLEFRIDKVDRWSIGAECYINLKDNVQCSKDLPIIVYKMPHNVSISPPNKNRPMVEGSEYQVVCDIVDAAPAKNLLVTWYRDDKRVFNQNFHNLSTPTPLNLSSVFKMTAHREDDQVKLMCEVKFDFGPTGPHRLPMRSASLTLQVHYPPLFLTPEVETVEVPADGKITLDCTAKGNPTPAYHWQVPEKTQPQVKNQPVLNLLKPFPGSYNCTASNSQGSSTKQFILTAPRSYTVLIVMIVLVVLLLISGPFIVIKVRTFLLNKSTTTTSSGQPASQLI